MFSTKEADMTIFPMSSSTLDAPAEVARAAGPRRAAPRLVPVRADRWRVIDAAGRIIGHLDDVSDGSGARFRASRYRRATGALVAVGEFSRPIDAVDALRYAS